MSSDSLSFYYSGTNISDYQAVSSNRYSAGGSDFLDLIVSSGEELSINVDPRSGHTESDYQVAFWFLTEHGLSRVQNHLNLSSASGYDRWDTGWLSPGDVVTVPSGSVCAWLNCRLADNTSLQKPDAFYVNFIDRSDTPTYTPTITATTSNITDTTVDLAIDVTGMDPTKTYNIRIDGTTADGEELSQVIGTITGEETYSTSATLGPFTPNTTYTATLVLVEDGVDVSSDLIEYTTLPPTYDPQVSVSQFAVTSTTMTSQVTLSGLDPSKQYRPYYRLSLADDDTVISQGYALDIMPVTGIGEYTAYSRINNLTANTEYRIIWALFEDGTEYVDAFDYFNFTTLDDGSGGSGSGSSDDNSGILLMILNKVSAILDTMNGGQSEGILASINEKLDSLIATLANPAERAVETAVESTTKDIADKIYNNDSLKITTDTVSDTATIGSSIKSFFSSNISVGDFFNLFNDTSLVSWFSEETAADLNTVPSVAVFSFDDSISEGEQLYYGDKDNLFSFLGLGGVD